MSPKLVGGSVSFDHAADTYDATRAWPEHVHTALTDALLAELRAAGAERLLEVGVGTGRISRPLMARGVRVTGVDIAPRMLQRLREQLGAEHTPPHLLLGDATRLPFADASFPAALIVHVLHLLSDWRRAIDELRRVLAPGGVFIHGTHHYPGDNPWTPSLQKRDEIIAALGGVSRKRADHDDINGALSASGGSVCTAVYADDEERTAPAEWLQRTRDRIDSWSWEIPEEVFPEFFARYEQWCREHYGDLERRYVQRVTYELEVWSFAR